MLSVFDKLDSQVVVSRIMSGERSGRYSPLHGRFAVDLPNTTPESISRLDLREVQNWVNLAERVASILDKGPFNKVAQVRYGKLTIPGDELASLYFDVLIAYKYHPTGGANSLILRKHDIEEDHLTLSVRGHVTGGQEVTVGCHIKALKAGLKRLITDARE